MTDGTSSRLASPPTDSSKSVPKDSRREAVRELLERFRFEHDLLVKRTAAFLTLNGLMGTAVAAGDRLPGELKALVATIMVVLNIAWLIRASAARDFIDQLGETAYAVENADVLPADAKLHRERTGSRWWLWFNTTNVFSIGIPIGLLMCWAGGLVSVPLANTARPGRFQLIPSTSAPPAAAYILDSQGSLRIPPGEVPQPRLDGSAYEFVQLRASQRP